MTSAIELLEKKRKERASMLSDVAENLGFSKRSESTSANLNPNLKEATFNFIKGKLICRPNLPKEAMDITLSGFLDADSKVQNCYSMMALNFIADEKRQSLVGKVWSRDIGHYYMQYYAFKTLHLVNDATFKQLNDSFFLPMSRQVSDYSSQNKLLPAGILIMYARFCILQKFFDAKMEVNKVVAITSFKLISKQISMIEDKVLKDLCVLAENSFKFLEDRDSPELKSAIIDSIGKVKNKYIDYLKEHSEDKDVIMDQIAEIDSLSRFVDRGR